MAQTALDTIMNGKAPAKKSKGAAMSSKAGKALEAAEKKLQNIARRSKITKAHATAAMGQGMLVAETQAAAIAAGFVAGYAGDKLKPKGLDLLLIGGLAGAGFGLFSAMQGNAGMANHALAVSNGIVAVSAGNWGRELGLRARASATPGFAGPVREAFVTPSGAPRGAGLRPRR